MHGQQIYTAIHTEVTVTIGLKTNYEVLNPFQTQKRRTDYRGTKVLFTTSVPLHAWSTNFYCNSTHFQNLFLLLWSGKRMRDQIGHPLGQNLEDKVSC